MTSRAQKSKARDDLYTNDPKLQTLGKTAWTKSQIEQKFEVLHLIKKGYWKLLFDVDSDRLNGHELAITGANQIRLEFSSQLNDISVMHEALQEAMQKACLLPDKGTPSGSDGEGDGGMKGEASKSADAT